MSSAKNKPQIPSVKSKIKAQGEELGAVSVSASASADLWVHGQLTWEFSHLIPGREVEGVCVWLVLLICLAFHGTSESRNYA